MLGGGPDTASVVLALFGASEWTVCLLAPEAWARDLPPLAVRLKASQAGRLSPMLFLLPLPTVEAEAGLG